jgi:Fe2+ transport system protein FeoA
MKRIMPLDRLPLALHARVVEVDWEHPAGERLMALGLLPDSEVAVVGIAPLGDPISIRAGTLHLAIRRCDAACVSVSLADRPEVQ